MSRSAALPMVMLEAERLAITVAPAMRGEARGRNRRPHIFADLDAEDEARKVAGLEQEIDAEGDGLAGKFDGVDDGVGRGGELTLLVEFAIVRQVGLGNDAEHAPAMDHHRAAVYGAADQQGRADNNDRRQRRRGFRHLGDGFADGAEQGGLHVKVVERIAGEAEFRADKQRRLRRVGLAHQLDGLAGVGGGVGQMHARACSGDPRKAVGVKVPEFGHLSRLFRPGIPSGAPRQALALRSVALNAGRAPG